MCVCVHMYIYTGICVCTHVYIYIYLGMCVCTQIHIYWGMDVCVHVHLYWSMCGCAHVHVYWGTHRCAYTHTHTHSAGIPTKIPDTYGSNTNQVSKNSVQLILTQSICSQNQIPQVKGLSSTRLFPFQTPDSSLYPSDQLAMNWRFPWLPLRFDNFLIWLSELRERLHLRLLIYGNEYNSGTPNGRDAEVKLRCQARGNVIVPCPLQAHPHYSTLCSPTYKLS